MNRFVTVGMFFLLSLPCVAQQTGDGSQDVSFVTGLITWVPFLFLMGLWWFSLKRMNVFGKRSYAEYMQVTQERIELIETHLADIASSLRKIAESNEERRQGGAGQD